MELMPFPKPERLTARLAIGITVLVIVPLAAGLYLLARHQYEQTIAARRAAAELENRILEAALRHQMIRQDGRLMTEILQEVGRQPEVRRAMVLDHDGVVRMSSRQPDVGARIPRDSPTCLVCHTKTPTARERWVLFTEDGAEVLRSVLPIVNRAECQGCHGTAKKLNGMLVLDISLAPVQAQLRGEVRRMGLATAILTVVLLGGVGVLVRRLVLTRLIRLGRTARYIAGGGKSVV